MIKKTMVKRTKTLYIVLVIIGLVFLAAGFVANIFEYDDRFLGFGSGFGGAAIALGIVGMVSLKRSSEDKRQHEINEKDERFIKIREKSAYSTFYVTMIGLSFVELVFVWLNYLVPCYMIIGLMSVHVISYLIFLHHYNTKF